MLDSPHTSAPMLMRGNALVLKTPVENAPRTSVEKHLSWSSDIPPAARLTLDPRSYRSWIPKQQHPQGPQVQHQESSEMHRTIPQAETSTRSPSTPHPPNPILPCLHSGNEKGCLQSSCLSSVTDNGLKCNIKTCIPVCLANDAGH